MDILHQDRKGRKAAEHDERWSPMDGKLSLRSVLRFALNDNELSRKTDLAFFAILV